MLCLVEEVIVLSCNAETLSGMVKLDSLVIIVNE